MKDFNSILYIYSNMDNSSQILLFLIVLVALMLISILIINQVTKKKNDKISLKYNTNKKMSILKNNINNSNDDIKPLVDLKKSDDNKINVIKTKEEDNIEIINEEPEEIVKVVSKRTSIDDITKLIEDTLEQEPINLTKFEEDQEENAIISYDELVKRAGAKKIVYKYEEDKNVLDTIEKKESIQKDTIKQEINTSTKKFQASKVISPVFGIQKEKEESDDAIETFIDLEDFSFAENKNSKTESQSDVEFLTSLKEFRSGLD